MKYIAIRSDRRAPRLARLPGTMHADGCNRILERLRGTTALRTVGLTCLGLAALGLGAAPAEAQCVLASGSNYTCSGAATTPQLVIANNAAVTTAPGFSLNTPATGVVGLFVSGLGALSYNDTNASALSVGGDVGLGLQVNGNDGPIAGSATIRTNGTITVLGGTAGIAVANLGSGMIDVTATGQVTAVRYGVAAYGQGDITINVAGVTANNYGIFVEGRGTGATLITASGAVTGTQTYGILAVNGTVTFNPDGTVGPVSPSATTGLTVNAAAVTGGVTGIYAQNAGTGATLVTATGPVIGTSNNGIYAQNDAGAGALTVQAAAVTGGVTGIVARNDGTGATSVTATGQVIGSGFIGVGATNGTTAGDLTVNTAAVTGSVWGIFVGNSGTGATLVTATGPVIGTTGIGILASNNPSAGALTIQVAAVTGDSAGIAAINAGTGATLVTATGPVTSGAGMGISVDNNAGSGALTVNATTVTGGTFGITTTNAGIGPTLITATGPVIGTSFDGISVRNDPTAGALTVNAAAVAGGRYGIVTDNKGTGATLVTATGPVVGTSNHGIYAQNGTGSGALTVQAVTVTGGVSGIVAQNAGTGATSVTATGQVIGSGFIGISASNGSTAGDLTINAAAVTGSIWGIFAGNGGTGATRVTATGSVIGTTGIGILANNNSSAGALTIQVAAVTGASAGIAATNAGTGATLVTATGPVTAASGIGISVDNKTGAGALTVNATTVTGGAFGIVTNNGGSGPTSITTAGLVEGGTSAIFARSTGQPIAININGLTRNVSGLSTGLAIETMGGPVTLTNGGTLVGRVKFDAGAHAMANNGTWSAAGGTSQFGGGSLVNAAGGTILAAAGGGATTTFDGLGSLTNRGLITMVDGATGDVIRQTGGNAAFQAGSVLAVDIGASGQSDRFFTTGTATLTGSTLSARAPGLLVVGSRYTVVTADGGVIGTFGAVTGGSAFRVLQDSYDANNAYLDVVGRAFVAAGATPNQIATGRALDTIAPSGSLYDAVVALPTDAAAQRAFDHLSGEIHASAKSALIEDSGFLREAAIGRLRSAFGAVAAATAPVNMADINGRVVSVAPTTERFAIWGQAYGAFGRINGDGNAARLSHSTGGFFLGMDGPVLDRWRIGLLAGYSRTSFNVRDRASSGASDNYHLGAYAGTQWGALGLRSGLAFSWHEVTANRTVAFAGFGDMLRANYGARTFQAFGEAGYRIDAFSMAFEPFVNLAHVSLATDGFSEVGGPAALQVAGRTTSTTFTTLGLRASTSFMLGGVSVTARGTLGWRHAFGTVLPLSTNAFVGSTGFTVAGAPIARDAAVIEAGLDFNLTPAATLGLSYTGQIAGGAQQHGFKGNLAVRF